MTHKMATFMFNIILLSSLTNKSDKINDYVHRLYAIKRKQQKGEDTHKAGLTLLRFSIAAHETTYMCVVSFVTSSVRLTCTTPTASRLTTHMHSPTPTNCLPASPHGPLLSPISSPPLPTPTPAQSLGTILQCQGAVQVSCGVSCHSVYYLWAAL